MKQVHVRIKSIFIFYLFFSCFLMGSLNVYAKEESVQVILSVEQIFINHSSATNVNDVFAYDLMSVDSQNPMPQGDLGGIYPFSIAGTKIQEIDPITFTHAGIYQYQIKAKSSSWTDGYADDSQIYQVTIYVSQKDDKLLADLIVKMSDGSKSSSIIFEPIYMPLASDPELMVDPPVKKTVSGNPPTNSKFYFTLTARDTTSPMPEGSVAGVKKITIIGSGEEDFGTWKYVSEGVYYYDIAEVISPNTAYTYDQSVYTITDIVKDNNGQLIVMRTVTNSANKQVDSCIFINQYNGNRSNSGNSGGSQIIGSNGGENVKTDESTNVGDNESLDSKETGSNQTGQGIDSPQTGDDSKIELYLGLFLLGIIIAIGCIIYLSLAIVHIRHKKLH